MAKKRTTKRRPARQTRSNRPSRVTVPEQPCTSCKLTDREIHQALSNQRDTGQTSAILEQAGRCRNPWCREKQAILADSLKFPKYARRST